MSEMNKMKIYSLPTYDHENDTFKDGPLPKNADCYFAKGKQYTNYYSEDKWVHQTIYNIVLQQGKHVFGSI